MQRFLLENNIARYERRLNVEADSAVRVTLQLLLADARRDLALFDSEALGSKPVHFKDEGDAGEIRPEQFSDNFLKSFRQSAKLYLIIDPGPGLKIVDANEAYLSATMTARADIAGKPLFAVFPDNPGDREADGVSNLFQSIKKAFESRRPHEMAIQRYDVRGPDGVFQKRYWRPVNSPLFDQQGTVQFILHHVEDVTAEMVQ